MFTQALSSPPLSLSSCKPYDVMSMKTFFSKYVSRLPAARQMSRPLGGRGGKRSHPMATWKEEHRGVCVSFQDEASEREGMMMPLVAVCQRSRRLQGVPLEERARDSRPRGRERVSTRKAGERKEMWPSERDVVSPRQNQKAGLWHRSGRSLFAS